MVDQRSVLITGAAGRIGSFLTTLFADQYRLVLADINPPADNQHQFLHIDITDKDALVRACTGIDTVVHLAADPRTSASWDSLLPKNVIGVYNIFEAAREAGCRRVVYASSINAVRGYPLDTQVHPEMPVRPLNLYGATKVWGEAVARLYADQHGLSALCLRFGWVADRHHEAIKPDQPMLDSIITYEDVGRLVQAAIEAPDSLRFGIFHGVSNNRYKRLDITQTRELLGYDPQDDAFELAKHPD